MLESPKSSKFNNYNINYSRKSLKLVNQQVTLGGTSETTREITSDFFNFNLFLNNLPVHKKTISFDFLSWFVGFVEGDASFIVTKNNRLFFILVQNDLKLLYKIKNTLGFGRVSRHTTCWRFIVADKINILKLIYLFNGNLLLDKTNSRFTMWLQAYNLGSPNPIVLKQSLKVINYLTNSWLSGFIEAEGCFNILVQSDCSRYTGFRIRLRFLLDQLDENRLMNSIKDSFGCGYVYNRPQTMNQGFIIDSLIGVDILINYLDKYSLKGNKKISFLKWCSVYKILYFKKHLFYNNEDIQKFKIKYKNIINEVKDIVRS